ncbi:uncharacterized protein A1O9_04055 [Exophiala aquamarina CBS 119918]|uniref:mRNA export factor MEX67 n=1 Tax=Exophiala aquamarina CBS 119918 TaxID=1182545 RepID=A0A072PH83_9EURO|nr:uncharacterized protein A1O9_04055 [Exophiala aquamarina CBS 119918]KEF59211.1 hypothetical protein A1O9_04055 [Exophiala aquamarina CBS 119918]
MSFGNRQNGNGQPSPTLQLAIKGWASSKLSTSKDQGVEALVGFLSKKASRPVLSYTRAGRTVLLITVNTQDQDRFFHLNGFTFAGATLVVEEGRSQNPRSQHQQSNNNEGRFPQSQHHSRDQPQGHFGQNNPQLTIRGQAQGHYVPRGPRGQFQDNSNHNNQNQGHKSADPTTSELENLIINVIRERYHAGDKHLILNALVADPQLTNSGLSSQDPAKVWRAIFTLCEKSMWETPSKRREAVQSVSLRDDNITSVKDILSLSNVFPTIKNLDLANNQLADIDALKFWKNQFRDLEHIILTGNPVASNPDTVRTLLTWYPNLKVYNNEPVRDAAGNITIPTSLPTSLTPSLQPQPSFPSPLQPSLPSSLQPSLPSSITPTTTPIPIPDPNAPTATHPEFPPGSTFGLPEPNKSAEVLQREQMGLQFSFETKLKMQWVENCLSANAWDYAAAVANFNMLRAQGQIPPEAYIAGV